MDTQPKKPKVSKKALIVIIVLVIILAVIIVWQRKSLAPGVGNGLYPEGATEDTKTDNGSQDGLQDDKTSVIDEDLGGINLDDLENEFKEIDADLNNL